MIHKSKNVGRILSLTDTVTIQQYTFGLLYLVLPMFNKLGRNLILEQILSWRQHKPKEYGLGQAKKQKRSDYKHLKLVDRIQEGCTC
jgi:hypothetical protein